AGGLDLGEVASAAAGSMAASTAAAALTLVAAMPVAVLTARHTGGWSRAVERLAYSGFALPGIVVALALVFFGANFAPVLYQSLPLLVLAYAIMFLPQASEPLRGALLQVSPRIEEAGRALGRGRAYVFRRVLVPLVSRGAMIGFALVFLTAMKELPATLLLRPTGFETLATRVWTAASVSRFSEAALPALLLLLLSAAPLSILARRVQVQEVRSE
ncbi:MAG: ABC transporter permease, partial [Actinomycetota bacterium]